MLERDPFGAERGDEPCRRATRDAERTACQMRLLRSALVSFGPGHQAAFSARAISRRCTALVRLPANRSGISWARISATATPPRFPAALNTTQGGEPISPVTSCREPVQNALMSALTVAWSAAALVAQAAPSSSMPTSVRPSIRAPWTIRPGRKEVQIHAAPPPPWHLHSHLCLSGSQYLHASAAHMKVRIMVCSPPGSSLMVSTSRPRVRLLAHPVVQARHVRRLVGKDARRHDAVDAVLAAGGAVRGTARRGGWYSTMIQARASGGTFGGLAPPRPRSSAARLRCSGGGRMDSSGIPAGSSIRQERSVEPVPAADLACCAGSATGTGLSARVPAAPSGGGHGEAQPARAQAHGEPPGRRYRAHRGGVRVTARQPGTDSGEIRCRRL